MNKFWKHTVSQQVNNTLNIYNGAFIGSVYNLLINLSILVYWEENIGQSRE